MRRHLVALLILVTACAGGGEVAPSTTGATTDCGGFVLGLEGPTAELEAGYDCLVAAFQEGKPARLIVTRSTMEGDPLPMTYLVTGPNSLSFIVDATQDKFGSGQVEQQTCTGVERDPQEGLIVTGCVPS